MAYNPLEELKCGNCSFLGRLTIYDTKTIIQSIRESFEKDVIINGFLPLIMDEMPHFCFKIIYDNPSFTKETLYLLNKYVELKYMDTEMFENFFSSPIAEEYVYTHFDKMLTSDEKLDSLFSFLCIDYKKHGKFLSFLRLHPNLHIRARFMIYLAKNKPSLLQVIYDNFMKYLTSYTHQEFEQLTFLPTLMDKEDISILAITLAQNDTTLPLYYRLKDYIFKTYPENDLAKILLDLDNKHQFNRETNKTLLLEDIQRLFQTSYNEQIYLFEHYTEYLSKEILSSFAKFLSYFDENQNRKSYSNYSYLSHIFYNGLGKRLKELLDRYLSLSNNTSTEFIRHGSTAAAFRIGDYVFKLSHMKWSYEDLICPNLYLFHQNLEEILLRNPKSQRVIVGIEVQYYLPRDALNVPSFIFKLWEDALRALGWKTSDSLMHGRCGDNCRLLNSYKDAYTNNLEALPDWFKEYPVVSVDRDRVYRLANYKHRKEIPEYFID